MKKNHYRNAITAFVVMLLAACAVTPRTSTWEGPKHLTKQDVYQASLQAGTEMGWRTTASDKESGTMSFSKNVGNGQMTLNVSVTKPKDIVNVRTTSNYGGGLAIAGLHEEYIKNFHVMLFRKLNITDPSQRNIAIREIQ